MADSAKEIRLCAEHLLKIDVIDHVLMGNPKHSSL